MKIIIVSLMFAITSIASSAQTSSGYQVISLERFIELKDSLATDSLLEFETANFYYINASDSTISAALKEVERHYIPDLTTFSMHDSKILYSSDNDNPKLLNVTYVSITVDYDLGVRTVGLHIIASRLNCDYVDPTMDALLHNE